MPDLTFLNSLHPLFSFAFMLGVGGVAGWLYFKGKTDQKSAKPTFIETSQELRVRWDGPIGEGLSHLKKIAEGFTEFAEVSEQLKELRNHIDERLNRFEDRIRAAERSIDRMPNSSR